MSGRDVPFIGTSTGLSNAEYTAPNGNSLGVSANLLTGFAGVSYTETTGTQVSLLMPANGPAQLTVSGQSLPVGAVEAARLQSYILAAGNTLDQPEIEHISGELNNIRNAARPHRRGGR